MPTATETVRLPVATYRLQFNRGFTLKQAQALLDYLRELGISDIYASPLFHARAGSLHGYDVVDPTRLNPELGTEEDLARLAEGLKRRDMGLLLDVVPNHMCIADADNRWWQDVLENGPSSPYARFFDIDWNPPKQDLAGKVLLPFLGDQFGRALENEEIRVSFEAGSFWVTSHETRLPSTPRGWALLLEPVLSDMKRRHGEGRADLMELESILTALGHLPERTETDPDRVKERLREKEIVRKRLADLAAASEDFRGALARSLADLNGRRGQPRSFDRLEAFLAGEGHRLCHWRVAADEINYRRFFDVNELAAIRMEDPAVFSAVHERLFEWIAKGWVTGLRVDHVDGLFDPQDYLERLQGQCRDLLARRGSPVPESQRRAFFTVVEKILARDERLRPEWPVHGTTGYDFLNRAGGLLVDPRGWKLLRRFYAAFTGRAEDFGLLTATCKKLIMHVSMSSEVFMLATRLDRVSEQHRWSRDFTLESLRFALREIIAAFPVYRTYLRPGQGQAGEEDRRVLAAAVRQAKRRNPATSESLFDFAASVMLLEEPAGLSQDQSVERRDLALRLQQLTGPVTAKGLEDTAFYRYAPLACLNEVGGDPDGGVLAAEDFHRWTRRRLEDWPHSLNATATHDTKRGEDVRARLAVLSEAGRGWARAVPRWRQRNRELKTELDGSPVPDPQEEYFIYQTLAGAWPLEPMTPGLRATFLKRISDYLVKALREAKRHTSWINPHEAYEKAALDFLGAILEPGPRNRFLPDFLKFLGPICRAGLMNSLSQVVLKIAAPGVPDFYQGTELWDFSLVDPDNRRPVDFERRKALLSGLRREGDPAALARRLLAQPEDGRLKLFVTSRALALRRARRAVFERGEYLPLEVRGTLKDHAVAFERKGEEGSVLGLAGRLFLGLPRPPVARAWGDTEIVLRDPGPWRDALTGRVLRLSGAGRRPGLRLSEAFACLPVALLEKTP